MYRAASIGKISSVLWPRVWGQQPRKARHAGRSAATSRWAPWPCVRWRHSARSSPVAGRTQPTTAPPAEVSRPHPNARALLETAGPPAARDHRLGDPLLVHRRSARTAPPPRFAPDGSPRRPWRTHILRTGPHECRATRACRVHDCDYVLGPLFQRLRAGQWIRESRTSLVEQDQPGE